jgi:hypothetical protein
MLLPMKHPHPPRFLILTVLAVFIFALAAGLLFYFQESETHAAYPAVESKETRP